MIFVLGFIGGVALGLASLWVALVLWSRAREQNRRTLWMSNHPALFRHNPYMTQLRNKDKEQR